MREGTSSLLYGYYSGAISSLRHILRMHEPTPSPNDRTSHPIARTGSRGLGGHDSCGLWRG